MYLALSPKNFYNYYIESYTKPVKKSEQIPFFIIYKNPTYVFIVKSSNSTVHREKHKGPPRQSPVSFQPFPYAFVHKHMQAQSSGWQMCI